MEFAALLLGLLLWPDPAGAEVEFDFPSQEAADRTNEPEPATEFDLPAETEVPGRSQPLDEAATEDEIRVPPEIESPQNLVPVESARGRLTPPELLDSAGLLPEDAGIRGRPLRLAEALARTTSEAQRLVIAQAYWDLSTALAGLTLSLAEEESLGRMAGSPRAQADGRQAVDAPLIRAALNRAAARTHTARQTVLDAQHRLAAALGQSDGEDLPLCVDQPHTGAYRTRFESIFRDRPAPARARLIDRTLPLARREIDLRAAAVEAAEDAVVASEEAYALGSLDAATVLACVDDLVRQRRAFLATVRQYNRDIAEFAVTVAPAGTPPEALVGMLIAPAAPAESQAQPARFDQPIESRDAGDERKESPPIELGEPTPADELPADELLELERQTEPPLDPSEDSASFKSALYSGLAGVDARQLPEQLVAVLHWDRDLPADAAEPVTLADCLRSTLPSQRRELIAAYWAAREGAARYQVRTWQAEHIEEMVAAAVALRHTPTGPESMLRLRAAWLAARADVLAAHERLLAHRADLTQWAGRPLEGAWLLPSTAPSAAADLVESRLDADRQRMLEHRAAAVVELDGARAAVVEFPQRYADTWILLPDLVESQAEATLEFLASVTACNRGIADDVLAKLPVTAPIESLAAAMVPHATATHVEMVPGGSVLPAGPRAF